ncbi:hypothetical protein AKJ50_01460 [candidate division MSBL1 archaeon SCGC-AAA382A13]|uniref:Uncharacterized protein n=1 Tax=candidate division MSBL1 archaeon SCGC-AAA382A13 TaxID=1698279 RepID=A0A133VFN7_9EURY|nr:hypothetical protein AKJ50_01460 [candidate division MSBL1 archaeon SCGC-AAA382A13]
MTLDSLSHYSDLEKAILDENLAKLGDSLVNVIYSLARSIAKGEADGAKVPNKILSDSLSEAGLRELAPTRMSMHELGDVSEAIIAFAWVQGKIEIKEAADILSDSLSNVDFENRNEVMKMSCEGFKDLLLTVSERIDFEKNEI